MEVLRLVYDSVQNLQRLPCTLGMIDGECVDQNDLIDEASKLLTMCSNIQQKILNAESISTAARNSATNGTEAISLVDNLLS
ncbi:unnamed protein product [Cercopithifilaria johnstoni]|uniref:Uncharacterized protein n=1 Tax=Cercopithifilaria johnstoni TaxID=2874296 RepID=A0A8J2LM48_9BILA|nr:unnamed protein product [Cercopithifilaria johnstoni]